MSRGGGLLFGESFSSSLSVSGGAEKALKRPFLLPADPGGCLTGGCAFGWSMERFGTPHQGDV
jgi:hypothetical protein